MDVATTIDVRRTPPPQRHPLIFQTFEGLPVGPIASAVLADAVLAAGDDAIRVTGTAHVRWVDDVAIFAPDARTRAVAFEALRRAWASLGLQLHDGKTVLLDEPGGAAHLGAMSNPTVATSALR